MRFLVFFLSFISMAMGQVEFLESQRRTSSPFGLPVMMNSRGVMSFTGGKNSFLINPTFQMNVNLGHQEYVNAVPRESMAFLPVQSDQRWTDVKKLRFEIGAGLQTIMQQTFRLGVAPFNGSLMLMTRQKRRKSVSTSNNITMPRRLETLARWSVGDHGVFETYGGISAYASAGVGMVNIVSGSIGFQNKFIVEVKKHSANIVSLILSEENLNRGSVTVGPMVSKATLSLFEGKRFNAEFILDLNQPLHHELYSAGVGGEIRELQTKLPSSLQRITWKGFDTSVYFGIPWIANSTVNDGHYNVTYNGVPSTFDVLGHRVSGAFVRGALHQKFVFHAQDNVLLFWNSEMSRATQDNVRDHYLEFGKSLGARGFFHEMPEGKEYGNVNASVGVVLTKEDLMAMRSFDYRVLEEEFSARCRIVNTSCKIMRNYRIILAQFDYAIRKPWAQMRHDVGLMFLKEPALLYAVLKNIRRSRSVYFKFMNDRFQSVEGTAGMVF